MMYVLLVLRKHAKHALMLGGLGDAPPGRFLKNDALRLYF